MLLYTFQLSKVKNLTLLSNTSNTVILGTRKKSSGNYTRIIFYDVI